MRLRPGSGQPDAGRAPARQPDAGRALAPSARRRPRHGASDGPQAGAPDPRPVGTGREAGSLGVGVRRPGADEAREHRHARAGGRIARTRDDGNLEEPGGVVVVRRRQDDEDRVLVEIVLGHESVLHRSDVRQTRCPRFTTGAAGNASPVERSGMYIGGGVILLIIIILILVWLF